MKNKSLDLMKRMGLIKDEVHQLLENKSKGIILEFALPRKKVKDKISFIFPQIIENWCLINYSITNQVNDIYINHWKNELSTHIKTAARYNIKENDNYDHRKTLINQIIIEEDLTFANTIDLIISSKFEKEKINTSSKEYGNTIINFVNAIDNIVHLISLKDRNAIDNYINNL